MKNQKTKRQAAAPGKAKVKKVQLNKETLTDLNVKSGNTVKGGRFISGGAIC